MQQSKWVKSHWEKGEPVPQAAGKPAISDAALNLIVKYEVSSKAYYDRYLAKPRRLAVAPDDV